MRTRGIIFDLDGTLADTLPDIADAVNVGLSQFGLTERTPAEVRGWVGEGLPTLVRRAIEACRADLPLDAVVAAVTAAYRERRLNKTVPFAGIPELLDALVARGIPMAVLTNKPHEHTVPMIAALFGKWPFIAVEGYRQEGRKKPDPRIALEIVGRMRAAPGEVMMVGDSFTDIATAINAGMIPVGATWGYRSRAELIAAGARHLIDRPMELLEL